MTAITQADLDNARLDVLALASFVNDATGPINTRLGLVIDKSLAELETFALGLTQGPQGIQGIQGIPGTDDALLSLITTKGDLLGGTGLAAMQRRGVGTEGQILEVKASHGSGMAWRDNWDGWDYETAETTGSLGQIDTFSHGLGVAPSKIEVHFVCKIAEHNYSVGDIAQPSGNVRVAWAIETGNTTQFRIAHHNASNPQITNKTTGANGTISFSNWDYVARASR